MKTFPLTLDLALIRWSVKVNAWNELASHSGPELGPFLAGWFCRSIGAIPADTHEFKDSFRAGWNEADSQIVILSRDQ